MRDGMADGMGDGMGYEYSPRVTNRVISSELHK
jgi:hypothetical protein